MQSKREDHTDNTLIIEKNKNDVPGQQWTPTAHLEYADEHVNINNRVYIII